MPKHPVNAPENGTHVLIRMPRHLPDGAKTK